MSADQQVLNVRIKTVRNDWDSEYYLYMACNDVVISFKGEKDYIRGICKDFSNAFKELEKGMKRI